MYFNNKELRPVQIDIHGKLKKGYFHRFVYHMNSGFSETKVLVELENGKLRYFDPYFVQFTDRQNGKEDETSKQSGKKEDSQDDFKIDLPFEPSE